jgi:hypothetical protein
MRDNTLAIPSLDERPRRDPAEPELEWHFAPPPRPREPNSDAERERRMSVAPQSSLPIGSVLYLVLVGLVAAAIIGVFFGAGFRLLAPPKEMTAASGAHDHTAPLSHGDILRHRGASPASPKMADPGSSAVAAVPAAPVPQHTATAETPPPPQPQQEAPSVPANAAPAVETAMAPPAQPSSISSPAPPTPLASLPESSKSDAAPPAGGKHRSSHSRKSHHIRSASRHPHGQSARSGQPFTAPQAGQIRSFDQLVTQLTGQPQPSAPSLTPPRPQQPDPFAAQRPNQ